MTYFPPGSADQPPGQGFGQPVAFGPAGPAGPIGRPRRRPGWAWIVLTLAILVAGIAWLIYGVASVASTIDDLQRVPVPGHGTVSLTHSGGYTVYYEGFGAQNNRFSFFQTRVEPASPGAAVASLDHYGTSVTYNIGSHQGRAIFSLRIRRPGRFTVSTYGTARPGADLAIGGSVAAGITGALLPSLPLIILGFGGTLVLIILRLVARRSARNAFA